MFRIQLFFNIATDVSAAKEYDVANEWVVPDLIRTILGP
jgi:hypothetical protein